MARFLLLEDVFVHTSVIAEFIYLIDVLVGVQEHIPEVIAGQASLEIDALILAGPPHQTSGRDVFARLAYRCPLLNFCR